jgi:hypothetical protein
MYGPAIVAASAEMNGQSSITTLVIRTGDFMLTGGSQAPAIGTGPTDTDGSSTIQN